MMYHMSKLLESISVHTYMSFLRFIYSQSKKLKTFRVYKRWLRDMKEFFDDIDYIWDTVDRFSYGELYSKFGSYPSSTFCEKIDSIRKGLKVRLSGEHNLEEVSTYFDNQVNLHGFELHLFLKE